MPCLEKGIIVQHKEVGPGLFEMEVQTKNIAAEALPGQFVHLRVKDTLDPLLRRPISIFDVIPEQDHLSLLYRVVGKGTQLMTGYRPGDTLDLMGPLGRGFSIPGGLKRAVLVGGGVGTAPLVYLARVLCSKGIEVCFLQGAQTGTQVLAVERMKDWGLIHYIATQDGSAAYHGLVTDFLEKREIIGEPDFVYTCGPEAMMAKVSEWAASQQVPGELSLEEHMACGVGACLGCARRLKASDECYVKVCKDGPVFGLHELELLGGKANNE